MKKIIVSFLLMLSLFVPIQSVHADNKSSNEEIVRDHLGRPLLGNAKYRIHAYSPNGEECWFRVGNGMYELDLVDTMDQADAFHFGGADTFIANGQKKYDFMYQNFLLKYFLGTIHHRLPAENHTLFGFLRVSGDRDYKYILLCNEGSITANFKTKEISGDPENIYFLISFEQV